MINLIKFKYCPICRKSYSQFASLLTHIENEHKDIIKNNNCISATQLLFNIKYKKDHGSCVICKKETKWLESVGRYDRFCSEKCKVKYRNDFKNKMIKKYGKIHLLNDPNKQKEMLANRKISGNIEWNGKKISYTGNYEKNFILFLKEFLNWDVEDLISPAPQLFSYIYEGKDHFYIPDFYIPSINTIIEVKDGGSNPNMHHKILEVDKVKEKLKDEVLKSQAEFNYLKITNNNFEQFTNYLEEYKQCIDGFKDKKQPLIIINEENNPIDKIRKEIIEG